MNEVQITVLVNGSSIAGDLHLVSHSSKLVIFAHGSGSSRFSERNKFVAHVLQDHGVSTLLFDLLTAEEDVIDNQTRQFRFDIQLLAERLELVTNWVLKQKNFKDVSLGYFGSSTGAAAALIASTKFHKQIKAVVSRGGRPDLAGESLCGVEAATLLIVGGLDSEVIDLNRSAYGQLGCVKHLAIVPGATHLFEESGKLETVAQLATEWFIKYL